MKGTPNDANMQLSFTAKIWDEEAQEYKPIYIAPDATSGNRGDVYLSDSVDSTDNAATGVTAATPAAVKKANDNANNKVDRLVTADQSIKSNLTPAETNKQNLGSAALKWATVYATTFNGNATSASKLQTARDLTIKNGIANEGNGYTISFNGEASETWNITQLDASTVTVGVLPLNVIPKAAQERLHSVANEAARFALNTDTVQEGDTVYQVDNQTMYLVVDSTKLNQAAGYQEYKAGTAVRAMQADKLSPGATIQTNLGSDSAETFTGATGITPGVSGTLPVKHGGTGATTLAQYGVLVGEGTGAIQSIGNNSTGAVYKSAAAANPTIGTLPVGQGGTGITSNPSVLTDLGTTNAASIFAATPRPGITGTLAIAHGGTGKTTAAEAWTNLGGGSVGKLNTNGSSSQFLRGDGTWQTVSTDDNKTKQTNSTANTAYPILLKNGTGTGEITNGVLFASGITVNPSTSTITATNFSGKATSAGSADSAAKWTTSRTVSLTGNVTGSTSGVDGSGNISIATTIGDKTVGLGKLADAVQTIYVGGTQPTDSHVYIWIDTSS